ncbi:MAG TPA: porin [Candidatus Eisenbacteria bacterium]|nr:porin [Candidatus Eisenbacteria bacterium]
MKLSASPLRLAAAVLILSVSAGISPAFADADTAALEKRLAALEQEVASLRRQLEAKKEAEGRADSAAPVVTANAKDGFSIEAADDSFKFRARGYVQADGRFFTQDKKDLGTTDTFVPRRVRPIFEGTVFKDYDFLIQPDFGNNTVTIQDAYAEYKYWPQLKLRAGKFKEPFGLERLQSDVNTSFIETGLPTLLTPNRDVGVQASGDFDEGWLTYQVGVFNGVADGGSADLDSNNDKDVAARVFAQPFKEFDFEPIRGLGGGAAFTFGHEEGATPTIRSMGQATVFSYNTNSVADEPRGRFSPQAFWYWNRFGVLGEYVESTQELSRTTAGLKKKIKNDAWQVLGTWVLTGEDASYKGVTPRHPFDPSQRTWGAFELATRYGELLIDPDAFDLGFASRAVSVSAIQEWALGLNWYLNRNVKLMLDYSLSTFRDGGPAEDRKSEHVILTRAQVQF